MHIFRWSNFIGTQVRIGMGCWNIEDKVWLSTQFAFLEAVNAKQGFCCIVFSFHHHSFDCKHASMKPSCSKGYCIAEINIDLSCIASVVGGKNMLQRPIRILVILHREKQMRFFLGGGQMQSLTSSHLKSSPTGVWFVALLSLLYKCIVIVNSFPDTSPN